MTIRKIGIAGAGTMGFSMARIFAQYDYEVVLYNHRQPKLDQAREKIGSPLADRILFTTDMQALAGMDLVVENIAEDLTVKDTFYRELSAMAPAEMIIATNTSGLSINRLSQSVKGPERFLGMHWFNPPHLIPLIEIINDDQTRPEVSQAIYDLALAIDKKPALVKKDVPGFAANRLQLAVAREALSLVNEGVIEAKDIDAVMKYGLGFRWSCLGPLETMDFGGLDVFYHVAEYLVPDLCDSHEIPALLAKAYESGAYGVKSGRGFYEYPPEVAAAKTAERDEKLVKVYQALYGKD